jgi:hypothetical protein
LSPGRNLDDFDRSDRQRYIIIFSLLLIVSLSVGGIFYWYQSLQPNRYEDVYTKLGVASLPPAAEHLPQVQSRLEQLHREPCFIDAINGLADVLLQAGFPRESASALINFVKHCPSSEYLFGRSV